MQWVLPPGLTAKALGGVFMLDWVNTNELSFSKTLHLFNPLNEGKPVKIARDGQEIDGRVAEELCRLFAADETAELIPHLKRMKKQTTGRPRVVHRPRQAEFRRRSNPASQPMFNGPTGSRSRMMSNNQSNRNKRDFRGECKFFDSIRVAFCGLSNLSFALSFDRPLHSEI